MAVVEEWQKGHDRLCALRYGEIGAAINGLKTGINKSVWLLVTLLIAVLGWFAVQMYGGLQADIHRNDRPAAVSTRTGG